MPSITYNFETTNRVSIEESGTNAEVTTDAGGLQLNAGSSAEGLATINSSLPIKTSDVDDPQVTFAVSNDLTSVSDHGTLWLLMGGTSNEDNYAGFELVYGASAVTVFTAVKEDGVVVSRRNEGPLSGGNTFTVRFTGDRIEFSRNGARNTRFERYRTSTPPGGENSTRWYSVENRKSSGTANNVNVTLGYVDITHD